MLNFFLIIFGKLLSQSVQRLNLGNGSTWPGHIALRMNKHFIRDLLKRSSVKVILIAGTNGKTTTATLVASTLEKNGMTVIQNTSGANLLNGIASTLLLQSTPAGKLPFDFAVFEVDENALPLVLQEVQPDYVLLLNLFRDQLDRYGEINTIAKNWKTAITKLPKKTTLILNADDPQIAFMNTAAKSNNTHYFGLQDAQFSTTKLQQSADSVSCPHCGAKLTFDALAYSHLGKWHCNECGLTKPEVAKKSVVIYPLSGLYNKYNTLAAVTLMEDLGLTTQQIEDSFLSFQPAFGRQEIVMYKKKNVQIFLSKNPTSFNQSYTTMQELGAKHLLIVLNDRIPDGQDISWIWDIDLPTLEKFDHIYLSGDRVYDMALRLKYELGITNYALRVHTYEDLKDAIDAGINQLPNNQTLFILPTYSAMLEVRKIITGKKIL